jgi:hypothetical protein
VPREDGSGKALRGNGVSSKADVGLVHFGETFTIAVSAKLESQENGEQVILTNGSSGTSNRAIQVLVEGRGDQGRVTFRSTGIEELTYGASTKPGTFPFGKWVRLVVTTDLEAKRTRIFIDGEEMDLPETEPSEDVATDTPNLLTLKDSAQKTMDRLREKDLVLEDIPEMTGDLAEIQDEIIREIEKEKENHQLRHEMSEANKAIAEARDILTNLEDKMDIAEMNNTNAATAESLQPAQNKASATPSEMYQESQGLEKQIAAAKADIDAAGQAVLQNSSYENARAKAMTTTPPRPDLASSLGNDVPKTVGELSEFRENLNRAQNEMQDMNARADAALGRSEQQSLTASSFASGAAMRSAARQTSRRGQVLDMTAFGNSTGRGNSREMRGDESSEGAEMSFSETEQILQIDQGKIIRSAIPGRRFTEASPRKGWLYLDTWYVIGPWENHSKVDFSIKHPPEFGIDFDAKYYDGKFADQPDHPDKILQWEFYQSDQVRCQPPAVYGASTYYAYTDVWFEEARDMLIAVGSDDAASMWLNGQLVWQDTGQSSWQLGEGYRKVHFKEGYNDVMVRIENGPIHCLWSVVLCPPEMLNQ